MTVETTTINPRVIFISALQPQDVTEGKLWYNTTTKSLYVSNGSKYVSMETDLTTEDKAIQENALNILVNSASATSTLNDWDNMILDRFIDADGQLNTIDTTNTTAIFDNNLYKNTLVLKNLSEQSINGTHSYVLLKTFSNINSPISSVKYSHKVYYNNEDSTVRIIYTYKDLTTYTSNQTHRNIQSYATFTSIPDDINKEVKKIQIYLEESENGPAYIKDVYVYGGSYVDKIIQTNPQTIDNGVKFVQVYSNYTTEGTGNITADISLDNGLTYTQNIPLNEKTAITSTDGTSLIMKLNLNSGINKNKATAKNYAIMLYY